MCSGKKFLKIVKVTVVGFSDNGKPDNEKTDTVNHDIGKADTTKY